MICNLSFTWLFWLVQVGLFGEITSENFAICCWWSVSCIYVGLLHPRIHSTHEIRLTKNTPKVKRILCKTHSFLFGEVENHVAKMQKQTIHGILVIIYIHFNDLKLLMKSQSFSVSQHIKMPPGLLSMAAGLDIFGSCLCPSGFFWNPALNPRVFRCSSTKRRFT